MRSISTKLILAFLSIGVISLAVIFITARWNTRQEFINFLNDQSQTDIVTELSEYHQTNGSWEGVSLIFVQGGPSQGMPGPGGPRRTPFVVTDPNGRVIVPNDRYKFGEQVSREDLEAGTPIIEDNQTVGILIPIRIPFQGNPRELEFIERINVTLVYGALLGIVIALLLGSFLSRTITRPIRELTNATRAISQGDLAQQVPIRSNDELGELARSFNAMSTELARSINTRKQITADIAHELRTPLSLILGHAEAVHDGVLPPTKENFEIIREEAARLEHLVNDLRILSLADAGELSINLQTIEPEKLVQDVISVYQVQTQNKNVKMILDIASPLPTLELDPARMTQVFTNIMDNALRYTPQGGTITISARQLADKIEFAMQDSGPGLPPEEAARIFERFYRTDPSRQREDGDGGSGLGLAIAKSIVQAHNGQVSAEGEAGKGLKVRITLPIHSPDT